MLKAPIPIDEEERLADLRQLELQLTTPEKPYDAVTRELARIFEVPGVFITFFDHDTQYYKSAVGLPPEMAATRTEPRELSVCNHVVGNNEMMVVEGVKGLPLKQAGRIVIVGLSEHEQQFGFRRFLSTRSGAALLNFPFSLHGVRNGRIGGADSLSTSSDAA